jgi:hypothetical protein
MSTFCRPRRKDSLQLPTFSDYFRDLHFAPPPIPRRCHELHRIRPATPTAPKDTAQPRGARVLFHAPDRGTERSEDAQIDVHEQLTGQPTTLTVGNRTVGPFDASEATASGRNRQSPHPTLGCDHENHPRQGRQPRV